MLNDQRRAASPPVSRSYPQEWYGSEHAALDVLLACALTDKLYRVTVHVTMVTLYRVSQIFRLLSTCSAAFIANVAMLSFMGTTLKLPTAAASQEAEVALRTLANVSAQSALRTLHVKPAGASRAVSVVVPAEAFEHFLEVLEQLANGNAVNVVPANAELTTQQAADMLNVSRPYLIKLVDEGELASRLVGTHRRIKIADLLAFKTNDDANRKSVLEELAAEAQANGLGY
jgi:excisionase family DNA binding protein